MSITTMILAAGASSRMGSPKALVEIEGVNFITRIANAAHDAGVASVFAVLGPPDGDKIRTHLPMGVGVSWNPDPSRGMFSSVQTGLSTLPSRTSAVLIWPVDHPLVRSDVVQRILATAPGQIVIPRHQGQGGHPVRVPQRLFGAIMALPTDSTLKTFFDTHAADIAYVDVDDPGCVEDIDAPADLPKAPTAKSEKKKK